MATLNFRSQSGSITIPPRLRKCGIAISFIGFMKVWTIEIEEGRFLRQTRYAFISTLSVHSFRCFSELLSNSFFIFTAHYILMASQYNIWLWQSKSFPFKFSEKWNYGYNIWNSLILLNLEMSRHWEGSRVQARIVTWIALIALGTRNNQLRLHQVSRALQNLFQTPSVWQIADRGSLVSFSQYPCPCSEHATQGSSCNDHINTHVNK